VLCKSTLRISLSLGVCSSATLSLVEILLRATPRKGNGNGELNPTYALTAARNAGRRAKLQRPDPNASLGLSLRGFSGSHGDIESDGRRLIAFFGRSDRSDISIRTFLFDLLPGLLNAPDNLDYRGLDEFP
jgi:hypothetical protein